MQVGTSDSTYEWIADWAKIPNSESARTGWAHHGIAITEADEVMLFHQLDPTVLVFDTDGNLLRSWDIGLTNAHNMTLVKEDGTEYLWMADNYRNYANEYYGSGERSGQAIKTTLEGETLMTVQPPDIEAYRERNCAPTAVAVNEERHGGNGDIWVADGYGEHYVHRYNRSGDYISSINGEEGQTGPFRGPHGLWIGARRSERELYIAEQSNGRIQVYDLEGNYKRAIGTEFLNSPSAFTTYGDLLVVVELRARLAVLDRDDNLACYLGEREGARDIEGWPNIPAELLEIGKFNAPHGIAADSDGNLYVVEWMVGGRTTKLAKR